LHNCLFYLKCPFYPKLEKSTTYTPNPKTESMNMTLSLAITVFSKNLSAAQCSTAIFWKCFSGKGWHQIWLKGLKVKRELKGMLPF